MNETWAFLKKGGDAETAGAGGFGRPSREAPPGRTETADSAGRSRTEYEKSGAPIEPGGPRFRPRLFKWLLFLVLIGYALAGFYRVPILQGAGKYLVVRDPPKKADLIVCLTGLPVERGLAAADLYADGLAPRVFFARVKAPDGLEVLTRKGVKYPEPADLLKTVLMGAGVPPSAWVTDDRAVESTFEEATIARAVCEKNRVRSLIVVTSPAHTRRAKLIFRRVLNDTDVGVRVAASPYSGFRAENWWKSPRYRQEVVLEYQKLLYEAVSHLW